MLQQPVEFNQDTRDAVGSAPVSPVSGLTVKVMVRFGVLGNDIAACANSQRFPTNVVGRPAAIANSYRV